MKRLSILMAIFAPLLLLSACRAPFSLPRATEPRDLALASVLALEGRDDGSIRSFAATAKRGNQDLRVYEGWGESISQAVLDSRDQGEDTVSYSHVEHLILDEAMGNKHFDSLLSFAFRNTEQSVESCVWILQGDGVESILSPDDDLAGRLAVLQSGGQVGTSLPVASLRSLAAAWVETDAVLIPTLRFVDDNLQFDRFALLRKGQDVVFLEGVAVLGLVMLQGDDFYWNESLTANDGSPITVQLFAKGCSLVPVFQHGDLKSLSLRCKLQGSLQEGETTAVKELEARAKTYLQAALMALRVYECDPLSLHRKSALSKPWRWNDIQAQWTDESLPVDIRVSLRLEEGL